MSIVVLPIEQTTVQLPQVWRLIQDSYEKWKRESGVEFNLLKYSYEDFCSKISQENLCLLVALDEEGHLLGTRTIKIHQKDNDKYAEGMWLAVSANSQRRGVGSKLMYYGSEYAKQFACEYVIEDTAVNAIPSVKLHVKNHYYIVGLASYHSTNYYYYVFRRQLTYSFSLVSFYKNKYFCYLCFSFSYIRVKLLRNKDGEHTVLGKFYRSLKRFYERINFA